MVSLSANEQQTRGMELLDMLRPATPTKTTKDQRLAEIDWNVVVRKGFIEVVIPAYKGVIRRSVSDSALPRFEKQEEMPWTAMVKDSKLNDASDVSTNVSTDEEGLYANMPGTPREDLCSSDGDADTEAVMAPMMPCQYMDADGVWWMPMMPMETTSFGDFDQSWMQWGNQSMDAVEYPVDADGEPSEWRTTVMIRNMPNNYTREMLLELVDSMGFAGAYDFAYLPVDFQSQAGLGYAFINFGTVADATSCFDRLEGFSDWKVPSEKVCTVTWSSPTQGFEAHIERYQNSPVMHHSIPDEWKPVLLQQGMRVDFPAPSKHIKAPKVRQHQSANKNGIQMQ